MLQRFLLLSLAIMTILTACAVNDDTPDGRLLLWHSMDANAATTFDEIFEKFSDIYPGTQIIAVRVPADNLLNRYIESASLGLGPDVLIGDDSWVLELVEAGLIEDLSNRDINTDIYLSSALTALRLNDRLYGIPLSLRPVALYYNTNLVDTPASTLDDLIIDAENGLGVGLNTHFDRAFWGAQAFGAELFDEQGRARLDEGGFVNWLNWLKLAQDTPGMVFSRDDATLRSLFVDGRIAYYIGGPDVLPALREAMGEATIGAVPLPTGPNGPSGPFLRLDAMLFNSASADAQMRLALELARFMTNPEQSATLMRETGRVPANRHVRVDRRAFPAVSGFASQARTAIRPANLPQFERVLELGDMLLVQVLEGIISETEAAAMLTAQLNEEFMVVQVSQTDCTLRGRVEVWHSWSGAAAAYLTATAAAYEERCPGVRIALEQFSTLYLQEAYREAVSTGNGPDVLIASSRWTLALVADELVTAIRDTTLLQRFLPDAQATLRYQDNIYGLPLSLNLLALYYNTERTSDPPQSLDDLVTQINAGELTFLSVALDDALWGVGAFGGQIFDENGDFVLDRTSLIDWVMWLRRADALVYTQVSNNTALLRNLFANGDVAFYTGVPDDYLRFPADLRDNIAVATLPGAVDAAAPPLTTSAAMRNPQLSEAQNALVDDFMDYLTDVESQNRLMTMTGRIPANVNAVPPEGSHIAGFLAQVENVVVLPNIPQAVELSENTFFLNVLNTDDVEALVDTLLEEVSSAHGNAIETGP